MDGCGVLSQRKSLHVFGGKLIFLVSFSGISTFWYAYVTSPNLFLTQEHIYNDGLISNGVFPYVTEYNVIYYLEQKRRISQLSLQVFLAGFELRITGPVTRNLTKRCLVCRLPYHIRFMWSLLVTKVHLSYIFYKQLIQ